MEKIEPGKPKSKVGIHSIGVYKLGKGLLFAAIAAGLFSISNMDPDDLEDILISYLHLDTDNRLWVFLYNLMDTMTATKIQLFGYGFISLSVLNFAQAVGLFLQKKWAAVLVIVEELIFIPFEIYQLQKHVTLKISIVLSVNVLIAVYLLRHWFLFKDPASNGLGAERAGQGGQAVG